MKTKEEILDHEIGDVIEYPHYDMNGFQRRAAISAMDEYAKQQAIAFADWLQFNFQPHAEKGFWYNHHVDQKGLLPMTTYQCYYLFIESLNK